MKKINFLFGLTLFILGICIVACGDNTPFETPGGGGGGGITGTTIPPIFEDFSSAVEVSRDGEFIILETDNAPPHGSPYYDMASPNHTPYNGTNPSFQQEPYTIEKKDFIFKIPMTADEASSKTDAPTDIIGIGVNGVLLYGLPEQAHFNGFDQHNGHVDEQGYYHYHVNPTHILDDVGTDGLVGMMLDGYAIYGPEEDGTILTSSDLDEFHGHVSKTLHYPDGFYHYHVTYESPYILGTKLFGIPGTVTAQ